MSEGTRHQYGLTVSAFLGGISFTIMAFLIEVQIANKFGMVRTWRELTLSD